MSLDDVMYTQFDHRVKSSDLQSAGSAIPESNLPILGAEPWKSGTNVMHRHCGTIVLPVEGRALQGN